MGDLWYDSERFRARFSKYFLKTEDDSCWVWTGVRVTSKYGPTYGQVYAGMRGGRKWMFMAHRVAWEPSFGPIPDGKIVMHKCDNPPCCRPDHLQLGTYKDNSEDMIAKNRSCKGKKRPGSGAKGEKNGNSKLTADMVLAIRRKRMDSGDGYGTIAKDFGVSKKLVMNIVKREIWKHIS